MKRPGPGARLAAIDVGSNSIRLLIAQYDPATGLAPIDEIKAQPRLAQGLAATGRLDPAAMERALAYMGLTPGMAIENLPIDRVFI